MEAAEEEKAQQEAADRECVRQARLEAQKKRAKWPCLE
jgi:hypothetical protein